MEIKNKNKTFDVKIKNFVNDNYYAIEVVLNKKVAGTATFKKNGNKIWLYKIKTNEEFQHQGIGGAVIDTLELFAMKNNCHYIEGKFFPENEHAKQFYENRGYDIYKDNYETYIYKMLDFEKIKQEIEPSIKNYSVINIEHELKL